AAALRPRTDRGRARGGQAARSRQGRRRDSLTRVAEGARPTLRRAMQSEKDRIGWIGVGRMGAPMVARLLAAGYEVSVWNRTRARGEALGAQGAGVAGSPAELASCDVVFTMVGGSEDFEAVTIGPEGVLSGERVPAILIDSSTVSADASEEVRR